MRKFKPTLSPPSPYKKVVFNVSIVVYEIPPRVTLIGSKLRALSKGVAAVDETYK